MTGRGTHAEVFFPVHPPVDDGCPPSQAPKDAYTVAWDRVRASLEKGALLLFPWVRSVG